MRRRYLKPGLTLFLLYVLSSDAAAFIDLLGISPAAPGAGEPIALAFRYGECDSLFGGPDSAVVTQSGNRISVVIPNTRNTPPFCILPVMDQPVNIGRFAAGSYVLDIDIVWPGSSGPVVEDFAVLPLVVSGTQEVQVIPALGSYAKVLTVFLILVLAIRALKT
jgi:hypothetical protein